MDAFDWLAHAIGQLYLAQPLTEVDFRQLKVRQPFMMHVTPLAAAGHRAPTRPPPFSLRRRRKLHFPFLRTINDEEEGRKGGSASLPPPMLQ